jgi:hypothetical protein
MNFVLEPIHLLVAIIAGWVNRQQQEAVEYLLTQCQVLIETHGPKRILLTDDQRRRLAVKGKILGRKRLAELGPCLRRTRSCVGTGRWWRRSGTIASAARREPSVALPYPRK